METPKKIRSRVPCAISMVTAAFAELEVVACFLLNGFLGGGDDELSNHFLGVFWLGVAVFIFEILIICRTERKIEYKLMTINGGLKLILNISYSLVWSIAFFGIQLAIIMATII